MVRKLGILKQISTKDPICLDLSSTFPHTPIPPLFGLPSHPGGGGGGKGITGMGAGRGY